MLKYLFFVCFCPLIVSQSAPYTCNSISIDAYIFDHGTLALSGTYTFSVRSDENGTKNRVDILTPLTTTFTKNSADYYFESEFFNNPDYHFNQPFEYAQDGSFFEIMNDTMDITFWVNIKGSSYYISSYFLIDQASISFQSGETIEQANIASLQMNFTKIWNIDITTTTKLKCVAFSNQPLASTTKQCSKFTIAAHITNITDNNQVIANLNFDLKINSDTLDISTTSILNLNSKYALGINFFYTTNYTVDTAILSIPLTGNRKYIFMLDFRVNELGFVSEYLGKFIKLGNNFLQEEGVPFLDDSHPLSVTRFLRGSSSLQLQSFMTCHD